MDFSQICGNAQEKEEITEIVTKHSHNLKYFIGNLLDRIRSDQLRKTGVIITAVQTFTDLTIERYGGSLGKVSFVLSCTVFSEINSCSFAEILPQSCGVS